MTSYNSQINGKEGVYGIQYETSSYANFKLLEKIIQMQITATKQADIVTELKAQRYEQIALIDQMKQRLYNHCPNCGQALDGGDIDE